MSVLLQEQGPVTGPPDPHGDGDTTIRRYAVRRGIMAVAKQLFARYGYEQVSLNDVAAGVHMSRADLHMHYRDKASLLAALLDDGWKDLLPRLKDVVSTSITAHSALLGVLSLLTSTLQNDHDLFRLLLLEGRLPNPKSGEFGFSNGYRRFMQLCRDLVLQGQKDGSFRPSLHPHVAASMLMGAFEGLLRDRLVAEQERSTSPYTGSYMMTAFDALLWSMKN